MKIIQNDEKGRANKKRKKKKLKNYIMYIQQQQTGSF